MTEVNSLVKDRENEYVTAPMSTLRLILCALAFGTLLPEASPAATVSTGATPLRTNTAIKSRSRRHRARHRHRHFHNKHVHIPHKHVKTF
jgi:hypothetical protein